MNIKGSGLEGKNIVTSGQILSAVIAMWLPCFFLVKLSHERAIKLKDVLATLGEGFISWCPRCKPVSSKNLNCDFRSRLKGIKHEEYGKFPRCRSSVLCDSLSLQPQTVVFKMNVF